MSEQQWKLVPVPATEEMVRAALSRDGAECDPRAIVISDYLAMIEVAPQPPALGGEAHRWQLKGFIPGIEGVSKAVLKPWVVMADDFDVHVARLQADLTSANADKAAYAQNAVDLRRQLDESRVEAERYQTSAACALTSAENIQAELNQAQARTAALERLLRETRTVLRNIVRDKKGGVHYAAALNATHQISAALAEGAKS